MENKPLKPDFHSQLMAINDRITLLRKNKLYLEAFFLLAALVEEELKQVALKDESWIKELLKTRKAEFNIEFYKNKKHPHGMTLGNLIDYFSIFHSDKELINDLSTFNSIRINIVHKLFKDSLENIENLASKNIGFSYKLLCELTEKKIIIVNKQIKSLQRAKQKINRRA